MYKDYNMTQLTLPMETSVLIPTNDISRHVNDIVEIKFGNQTSKFKITAIPTKQSVRTDEVAEMVD